MKILPQIALEKRPKRHLHDNVFGQKMLTNDFPSRLFLPRLHNSACIQKIIIFKASTNNYNNKHMTIVTE